ncbi:MFS transporter (macronuclear) [Tetrahymena thermophila SB210]|uniref:MFS transporter n=1 Tax=Tetrahymena thermophila (strain SB210) TaxID=312017 RepID=Q239T0_TETTS|nr:MFS transporter [Tetrahymena thermophila SB210]EAR93328.2 MFS transporter [Tetrahymena thermophila SB210]|eukprot:XP_001013573.2 MFS transporter [Tetrahymena thermophila SB210]
MGSGVFTLVWPTTKAVDTGTSQAVPHLSTNPALRRLTSEFEWDPVFSPQYGRQQNQYLLITIYNNNFQFVLSLNNLQFTLINQYQQKQYLQNDQKQKGCRHWDFPSGPPPQYQPSLKALNFGVRMGSGVFTLVWPTTKLISINNYLQQQHSIIFITQQSTNYSNKLILEKIIFLIIKNYFKQNKKVVDTGTSQAVPHLSTNPALRRLTSEFEWDPVFSPQYGRQQNQQQQITIYNQEYFYQINQFKFIFISKNKKLIFFKLNKIFILKDQNGIKIIWKLIEVEGQYYDLNNFDEGEIFYGLEFQGEVSYSQKKTEEIGLSNQKFQSQLEQQAFVTGEHQSRLSIRIIKPLILV